MGSNKGKMSRVTGYFKNITLLTAFSLAFTSAGAMAADVNLSGMDISKAEDGYNIVLKTDKKTSYKKVLKNSEQLVIEMKNTAVSEDFSTTYNDAADINNVTVNPLGKDDLKIQIQGSDVEKSNISLDYKDAPTPLEAQNFDQNQINLSLPVTDYRPIYNEDSSKEEETETSMSSLLEKFNPVALSNKIKGEASLDETAPKQDFKWMTYLGLFIIMATAGVKIFKSSDNNTQVGLTQSFKERERNLAKKLNTEVKETLSLRSKIAQNANAPSINYGLRSYQNAQKNPYENALPTARIQHTSLKNSANPTTRYGTSTLKAAAPSAQRTYTRQNSYANRDAQPTITRASAPIQPTRTANVDSMKFLESMTKIYEKSGRTDLAMGLKNTIKKANI